MALQLSGAHSPQSLSLNQQYALASLLAHILHTVHVGNVQLPRLLSSMQVGRAGAAAGGDGVVGVVMMVGWGGAGAPWVGRVGWGEGDWEMGTWRGAVGCTAWHGAAASF